MNLQLRIARTFVAFSRKQSQKLNFDSKNQNFQAFNTDMKKDVYEEYQKQIEKDSILKKFRRQVFKKQEISQQMLEAEKVMQEQSQVINNMLNKGTRQEINKYSTKIMEKIINNKRVFKQHTTNAVFSDYGDYSSYKSNFLKVEDRKLGDFERIDIDKTAENAYKFIDQLPDEYQEKRVMRQRIKEDFVLTNENMTISEYGKVIQQRNQKIQRESEQNKEYYQNYLEDKQIKYRSIGHHIKEEEMNFGEKSRNELDNPYSTGRLSTQAMNTIYECYIQGWSIRDISKRYGILPKRAKFVIWARAQLYDQFLTKYGIKYIYQAYQHEYELQQEYGVVDYGLDLDLLATDRLPDTIVQWNSQLVDAHRKEEQYTEALQFLEKNKVYSSHQKVQVGTHGKQNKMYLLKQWNIFRGKGSDYYHLRNNTFKQLSRAHKKMVKEYY